jgi:hypothetical protein
MEKKMGHEKNNPLEEATTYEKKFQQKFCDCDLSRFLRS